MKQTDGDRTANPLCKQPAAHCKHGKAAIFSEERVLAIIKSLVRCRVSTLAMEILHQEETTQV